MKKLVIVVLLLNCIGAKAQPYFSKMYDLYGHWESFTNVMWQDSNLILAGNSRNFFISDSSRFRSLYLASLDKNFSFIKQNKIAKNFNNLTIFITINGMKHKFSYGIIDTNYDVTYNIIDVNNNLEFSNNKPLNFLNKTTLTCFPIYNLNNKLYFWGNDYSYNVASKLKLSMQCMDTNGNKLWGKVYQDKRCYTNNVVQTKDGNFLLAGFKYFGESTGSSDSAFAWYAKVDTLGNILWEQILDRGSKLMTDATAITKADNSYYLTGTVQAKHKSSWYGGTSFCFMAKINENNGEIEWQKRFLYNINNVEGLNNGFGNFIVFKNGYLYALISHNVNTPSEEYVMFAKFDLQGNILWKRLFQQATYSNRFYSLTPTEDGFLICGDAKDSTKAKGDSDAWLIKTDTNGCIIPGCNATDNVVQIINPEKVFTVYPNPAQNEINVELNFDKLNYQYIESLAVYNMQGQLIKFRQAQLPEKEITKINTEDLANGNYLLIITTDKKQMAGKKFVVER